MNVLVFNCGSSSQSVKIFQADSQNEVRIIAAFKARNVDTRTTAQPVIEFTIKGRTGSQLMDDVNHREAAQKIITLIKTEKISIDSIGHRFVHGGRLFNGTTGITPDNLEKLRACYPLAPIHNPNSGSVIEVCMEEYPGTPQFAVFDTAFHAGMPEAARQYALPRELVQKNDYYKVGFHGLSCQYVTEKTASLLGKPMDKVKLIICHLGTGGSSVTAFMDGHTVETSMGYSPLAGLVMSTRCGDLDPEIILDMVRKGMTADEIDGLLNRNSGLIGLSGKTSNLAEIIEEAEKGDLACLLAYEVYANRLKNYLGAYTWQLNGADAILFTDDIGVKSWKLRKKVLGSVQNLGVTLDEKANQQANPEQTTWVQANGSRTKILVIPNDEERVIFDEVARQFNQKKG